MFYEVTKILFLEGKGNFTSVAVRYVVVGVLIWLWRDSVVTVGVGVVTGVGAGDGVGVYLFFERTAVLGLI